MGTPTETMQHHLNQSRKLSTIEDFLTNEFKYDCNEYSVKELFEILSHVTLLLETTDGTLSPEQQAKSNVETC
jgi:hypothetical protein